MSQSGFSKLLKLVYTYNGNYFCAKLSHFFLEEETGPQSNWWDLDWEPDKQINRKLLGCTTTM